MTAKIKSPIKLDRYETKVWNDVCSRVAESDLREIDLLTLASYCQTKALYYQYHEKVKALPNDGLMISEKNGFPYAHPLVAQRNVCLKLCLEMEKIYGFNPKGRRDVSTEKQINSGKAKMMAMLKKPTLKSAK